MLPTSSEKPKSSAMAERLGAIKFWSEYSSATTIVYSASVKVVDLRLQHKRTGTPYGGMRSHDIRLSEMPGIGSDCTNNERPEKQ